MTRTFNFKLRFFNVEGSGRFLSRFVFSEKVNSFINTFEIETTDKYHYININLIYPNKKKLSVFNNISIYQVKRDLMDEIMEQIEIKCIYNNLTNTNTWEHACFL
jgi:hypothetical protein